MVGYSLPLVGLSSASQSVISGARWHFGLIFRSRGDSLRTMTPESRSYLSIQTRRRHAGVLVAAALSLFLVLALATDVWARSSGGRYGGRAGFSQSRSGSSGGGWSSSRPTPTQPYNAPAPPSYGPSMPSPGFGFFPFLLPFLGWGGGGAGFGAGGGFGFGGIFGLLIIL